MQAKKRCKHRGIITVNYGKCSRCGKEGILTAHHLIPRWLGGNKGDIIQVCMSCHTKLEAFFDNFIKYGSFNKDEWLDKEKVRKYRNAYRREYYRDKYLFIWTPAPKVQYRDYVRFNIRTAHIIIGYSWRGEMCKEN